jgi:hypothetical protein
MDPKDKLTKFGTILPESLIYELRRKTEQEDRPISTTLARILRRAFKIKAGK